MDEFFDDSLVDIAPAAKDLTLERSGLLRDHFPFDEVRANQEHTLDRLAAWNQSPKKFFVLEGPTGFGKCFAPGTPVLMHDGTVRTIQDVRVGDSLMGDDSTPRRVLLLSHGFDQMFDVVPVKGDSYRVNSRHILSLKFTKGIGTKGTYSNNQKSQVPQYRRLGIKAGPGATIDIPLSDYLDLSKSQKHILKGYRVGVEFPAQDVPIDPYFLGLWLGDGDKDRPAVTTADPEIGGFLCGYAKELGLSVNSQFHNGAYTRDLNTGKRGGNPKSREKNPLLEGFRGLSVLNNKHIPLLYKRNSREVRMKVLAGVVDSDGSRVKGGYEFTLEIKRLAEDLTYLCRSLGFAAYMKPCEKTCTNGKNGPATGRYYQVLMSGFGVEKIPSTLIRKQGLPRKQKKDPLVTGIKVLLAGYGEFFGFSVDGNERFLLGDFTVVHNSPVAIAEASFAKTMPGFGEFSPGAHILTPQKTLAAQYMDDFARFGLKELKGRANYHCDKWTDINGEDIDCEIGAMLNDSGGLDERCDHCPYRADKDRYIACPLGTTNFSYYLNEARFAGELPRRNMLILDEGHNTEECHPPETEIDICVGFEKQGRQRTAKTRSFPIASLTDGQKAVSWNRASDSLHLSGRQIRVGQRQYTGTMLTVESGGKKTRVTPNHWFWVRFNSTARKKYILYLMHKEGYGYRIGVTRFRSASQHGLGLVSRMRQEGADKGWVLALYDSYSEAAKWEKTYSLKHGIADTCFRARKNVLQSDIKDIFLSTRERGALACLRDHGRYAEYPIWETSPRAGHKGYFKVRACNLLPEVMDLPARKTKTRGERRRLILDKSTTVTSATSNQYTGMVYSLDVAEDHTYVADGMIVGNCILSLTDTVIDKDRCEKYGVQGRLPEFDEGDNEAVLAWLDAAFIPAAQQHAVALGRRMREARDSDRASVVKKVNALERFLLRVNMFRNSEDPAEWFAWTDAQTKALTIKPLTGRLFADDFLFSKAQKVLILSATILDFDTFMRNLGIRRSDAETLAVDSDFPVENRPLFYRPVGDMRYADIDRTLPLMAPVVGQLMDRYATKKGIVHTNSYKVNRYMVDYLRSHGYGERVVTHDSSRGAREQALQRHLNSPGKPTVLFSPSMFEGLDLKEDLSRFQIMCKVPYPALDPYVRARMRRDPEWYQWCTALKLVQASGRSIRSKTDRAHTHMLDAGFAKFIQMNNRRMPKWWLDSIVW